MFKIVKLKVYFSIINFSKTYVLRINNFKGIPKPKRY